MHKIKPYFLFLFTIPVIIFTLYSCANKPNIPYPGRMSENFAKLEQWNPLLASEIRKLPEFQDGITIQEKKALDDLVELYADNPKVFSNAFKQMYQVGIPEVRKYCSPLQALFWLALEGDSETINYHIKKFRLKSLLNDTWDFSRNNLKGKYLDLSRKQAKIAIQGYKEGWVDIGLPLDQLNNRILETYYEDSKSFNKKEKALIKNSIKIDSNYVRWKDFNTVRWKDFNTVVERLNAPVLVDYYEKSNFRYRGYQSHGSSPRLIFKRKDGNCDAYSSFTVHCLQKGGYKARILLVQNADHWTSMYKLNNKYYLLDNAWWFNGIRGPFSNFSEVLKYYE